MSLKRKFGEGSTAERIGFTLGMLIGWLEDQVSHEDDITPHRGKYRDRLDKAEEAVRLLNEVYEE